VLTECGKEEGGWGDEWKKLILCYFLLLMIVIFGKVLCGQKESMNEF
jgi:hypothetical protein